MGKEIAVFKTAEVLSRVVNIYGTPEEPLFLAQEVAEWIEHSNSRMMLQSIDDSEKGVRNVYTPGGPQDMWFLTEDGFYEVLMQSRKPIAKQFKSEVKKILKDIRKHGFYGTDQFVENALSDPDTLITILQNYKTEREERLLAQQAVLQLEEKVEADKPKVLFADSVTTSKTEILVGELAKLLKQNGVCIGQNRLFQWLRDHGYLMKGGSSKNMPTQQSMDLGLMNIKERAIINPDGSNRITKTPKITGKGQLYFVNKFLSRQTQAA